jgi:hypothetical protein
MKPTNTNNKNTNVKKRVVATVVCLERKYREHLHSTNERKLV